MKQQDVLDYLILTALVATLAVGTFLGERFITAQYATEVRARVQGELVELGGHLETSLNGDVQLVKGLLSVIAVNPHIDQRSIEAALRPIFAGHTNLRNVALAPNMVIRLVYPLQGNEKALGLDYRKTPGQFETADKARTTRQIVLAGPLQLVQGGTGLIARLPVFHVDKDGQERFWGLVSAVIDIDKLYVSSGLRDANLSIEIALRGADGRGADGDIFMGRAEIFDSDPVLTEIKLPHGSWQMAAIPKGGWTTRSYNVWPLRAGAMLVALILLGAFISFRRAQ